MEPHVFGELRVTYFLIMFFQIFYQWYVSYMEKATVADQPISDVANRVPILLHIEQICGIVPYKFYSQFYVYKFLVPGLGLAFGEPGLFACLFVCKALRSDGLYRHPGGSSQRRVP